MAETPNLDTLDAAAPVLALLGGRRASISWQQYAHFEGGFYSVDWIDERNQFFSGNGDTPSEAVARALANGPAPKLTHKVQPIGHATYVARREREEMAL